ncbi:flagellar assembly peptidoglycan hydrolase FlgJ [Thauera sp. WH-1]|uniref:flagellar assembly peptidoglycan hydrolase FlgJ n=1 Tax=Thauera sp. WH-1 TaxID=3398230 RepID=UPI0039FD158A
MNAGFQLNAFDPNALGDLKRLARTDGQSDQALRAAAKQFEALLLQMVMKSMRDATPASSLMDGEQTKMYQSLLDQQMALNMAQSRGTGLSEVIFRQLGGTSGPAAAIDALDGGDDDKPEGFDIANVIRRAAIPAVSARAAESAAALAALPPAYGVPGMGAGLGTGGFEGGSILEKAILENKLRAAVRSARDAGDAVSQQARDFVSEVWPHALEASRKTGIPPQFMVAQAALETGWGQKQLRHADGTPSHNLFNIKAGAAWTGRTVDLAVTEYTNGRAYSEPSRFRAYGSYAESFRDYANLMMRSPRYAGVLGQTDPAGFARSLQDAGYATDPMYADKLTRIIGGSTLRGALALAG